MLAWRNSIGVGRNLGIESQHMSSAPQRHQPLLLKNFSNSSSRAVRKALCTRNNSNALQLRRFPICRASKEDKDVSSTDSSVDTEEEKRESKSDQSEASSQDTATDSESSDRSGEELQAEAEGVPALMSVLKSSIESGNTDEIEKSISALESEFLSLTEQVNEAKAKAKAQEAMALAAKEQFLRSTADFENFRKRSQQEKESLQDSVRGDVVKDFLPLVDNFELASKQLKLETEGEKKIDSAYQGLYRQMVDIFRSLGVAPVDTVGKPFDPELHEAIMREPSDEVEDGVVLEEFRRGFKIGEKLLRPAMVKVAMNDGPSPSSASSDWEDEGKSEEGAKPEEDSKKTSGN